jgi:hypothetical protein
VNRDDLLHLLTLEGLALLGRVHYDDKADVLKLVSTLRAEGHDIKPPVSAKQAARSEVAANRRKSFCARMSGMPGPMKDDKGRPTRKALSLRKWDCN